MPVRVQFLPRSSSPRHLAQGLSRASAPRPSRSRHPGRVALEPRPTGSPRAGSHAREGGSLWSGSDDPANTDPSELREAVRSFAVPAHLQAFGDQWRWSLAILLHSLWRSRCHAHLSSPSKVASAATLVRIWRADLSLQLHYAFLGREVEEAWKVHGRWMSGEPRPQVNISWPRLPASTLRQTSAWQNATTSTSSLL